jgi:hypothetical protein
MKIRSHHTNAFMFGLVFSSLVFSFSHVVGADSTSLLCGPIVWTKADVPAGASSGNVPLGTTSTIYWSVPYEDRSIQTTIRSYTDLEEAEAYASGAPQRNANDHWQSEGGYGEAAVYFRETANGNQYTVQGLYGGYNFVTVSTSAIFGQIPTLWTVPLEVHTALFDQALSMINAKCGSTAVQADIRLGDMARPPFTAGPAADTDPSFWLEFIDPEGIQKLNFSSFSVWSELRSANITEEFVVAFMILQAAGKVAVEATSTNLKVKFNIDFPDLRYLIDLMGWQWGDAQEDTLKLEIERLDAGKTRLATSATFHLYGKAPGVTMEFVNVYPWSNLEKPWIIAIKDGDGLDDLDWSTFRIEQVHANVSFENWFFYYLTQLLPLGEQENAEILVQKDPSGGSDILSEILVRFGFQVDRCKLLFFPQEGEVIRVSISDKLGYTAAYEQKVDFTGCLDAGP